MRAIEAETFSSYGGLRQIEVPKPQPAKDRVHPEQSRPRAAYFSLNWRNHHA
jgi:hypothetical protein